MPRDESYLELRCASCRWLTTLDGPAAGQWLRERGLLHSHSEASPAEIREILRGVAPRQACPECSETGLAARVIELDDEDWLGAICCESCNEPIPKDRLEALPGTRRCKRCAGLEERGLGHGAEDYCPRCGSLMVLRQNRSSGITRNAWVCSAYPRCR